MSEDKKKKKNIEVEISYTDNSEVINGTCVNFLESKAGLISIGQNISDISSCIKISDEEINIGEYKYSQQNFQSIEEANKYIEEFKNDEKSLLAPVLMTNSQTGITTVYTPVLEKVVYVNVLEQKKQLHLEDLKSVYNETGSAEATYAYLKESIIKLKDNSEDLKNIISSFLGDLVDLYDNDRGHKRIDENQVEILDKILNADGELKDFICGTIHGFVMETLQDCGIEAAILAGRSVDSENHAVLLYKCGENKYIFNDYKSNSMIEASNILDAAKIAYKKSGRIESAGFVNISDDKKSYREFILNEAAYSELYDKNFDNKDFPLLSMKEGSAFVKVKFNTGKNGEIITDFESTSVNNSEYNLKNISYGVQYKKGKIGELLDNSSSIGFNFDIQKDNQEKSSVTEFGATMSYTQGLLGVPDGFQKRIDDKILNSVVTQMKASGFAEGTIRNAIANINSINDFTPFEKNPVKYLSTMLKGKIGKYETLYSDSNLNIENTVQASGMITNTLSINNGIGNCIDGRAIIEDGVTLQYSQEKSNLGACINAGVVVDANSTYGSWIPRPIFGSKVNLGMSGIYKINEQTQVGLSLQGYQVDTNPAKDLGALASAHIIHRPKAGNTDFIFNMDFSQNERMLKLTSFKEKIKDEKSYSVTFKALVKDKYSVGINYNRTLDKLNSTKNKKTFGINFGMNF